jgi:hypothetical protein
LKIRNIFQHYYSNLKCFQDSSLQDLLQSVVETNELPAVVSIAQAAAAMSSSSRPQPSFFFYVYVQVAYGSSSLKIRLPSQPRTLAELRLLRHWLLRLGGACYDRFSATGLSGFFYHPRFLDALLSVSSSTSSMATHQSPPPSRLLIRCTNIDFLDLVPPIDDRRQRRQFPFPAPIFRHICAREMTMVPTRNQLPNGFVQLLDTVPVPPRKLTINDWYFVGNAELESVIQVYFYTI